MFPSTRTVPGTARLPPSRTEKLPEAREAASTGSLKVTLTTMPAPRATPGAGATASIVGGTASLLREPTR
nr:hypothetical protein [Caldimonas tepidiphila]